ncbi:MAG: SGNH/GDSL hydrolase family protein [Labilithrix sp.]
MRRSFVVCAALLLSCSQRKPAPADAAAPADAGHSEEIRDAAPEAEAAPPALPARSLKGKKVLHVGDSMVGGTFGLTRALEKKLTPEGAKLVRRTTVSESLNSFDKGPILRDALRDEKPDIVIVTLGANDVLSPHPEMYGGSVERIVKRIGDRECWWIGPPRIKTAVATPSGKTSDLVLSEVIKGHVGTCKFFDSSALKIDRASDGIHPSNVGGETWIDAFWPDFVALPESKPE